MATTSQTQGNIQSTSQIGVSANSQGAIIDSVNNGLRAMVMELGKLSDTLIDVRKEQVQNYKAEKRRNEVLASEIAGIWKTPLRELNKSIRESSKSTISDTEATVKHAKAVGEDSKALGTSATQSLKVINARKREEQAIKDAERMKTLSKRKLQAEVAVRSTLLKTQNRELLAATNHLEELSKQVVAASKAGKVDDDLAKRYAVADAKFHTLSDTASATTKGLDTYKDALTGHVSVLKGTTSALKTFAKGLAFGQMTKKLYEEAQSAKVTGNYANSTDFMSGQGTALSMGLGSQTFNEITASARAASLTTTSMGEFYNVLESSTDRLQTITTSREESARLSAQVLQGAATAGISAKVAATQMDALATNAMKLSKITGQSATDMMKLSVAITEDRDHRETMLGLNQEERANYVKKQSQDLLEYKLQGYSLEQAQELQKIAMQTRTQGISERIGNQSKLQSAGSVLANLYSGSAGFAIRENLKKQAILDAKGRTGLTGVQSDELEKQKKENAAELTRLEAQAYQTQQLTEVQRGIRADRVKQLQEASGVSAAQSKMETAVNPDTLEAKVGETSQGAKGSPLDIATTLAGYGTALKENTTALWAVAAAVAVYSVVKGGLGISDLMSTGKGRSIAGIGRRASRRGAVAAIRAGRVGSGLLPALPTAGTTLAAGRGLMIAKSAAGGVGGLAGLGLGVAADKAGGYGTNAGTVLNLGSNIAEGAGTGAMLGALLGPPGAMIGGIAGGVAGAGVTAYNYYNSPSAKLARQEQAAKEKVEKETAEQQKKQNEMNKDRGIRSSSTDDLQREFFMLAIEFYRNADPLADKETRAKHAEALHRIASHSNLNNAGWAASATQTGS